MPEEMVVDTGVKSQLDRRHRLGMMGGRPLALRRKRGPRRASGVGGQRTELPWEVRRGFQRWRRVGKKPRRGGSSREGVTLGTRGMGFHVPLDRICFRYDRASLGAGVDLIKM